MLFVAKRLNPESEILAMYHLLLTHRVGGHAAALRLRLMVVFRIFIGR